MWVVLPPFIQGLGELLLILANVVGMQKSLGHIGFVTTVGRSHLCEPGWSGT